jgi:DNA-binding MarR family transcriptional regulator
VLDAELIREHELSAPAYEALLFLHDAPDRRMRMGDLAAQVLFTPSGISRLVERLERDGLVRRIAGGRDGRERLAELTDAGSKRLREAALTHVAGVRRLFLAHLTPEDLDRLGDVWDRTLGIVGATAAS